MYGMRCFHGLLQTYPEAILDDPGAGYSGQG